VAVTWLRNVALLARTVRHLHVSQLAHRVRLRAQRAALARTGRAQWLFEAGGPARVVGWPTRFLPLDARAPSQWASPDLIAAGRIRLLGHDASINGWECQDTPELWRFHLHYWDWTWPLVCSTDQGGARVVYARLFDSWRSSTTFGRGDAWSPYVASLRAWSWCGHFGRLVEGTVCERSFVRVLWTHARYLRAHLELDVGGNHLIKNLKALVGLGVFFGKPRLVDDAMRRLRREVHRQILPDGGHYERAPAYHCQVLGDLIDLAELLTEIGGNPPWLRAAIAGMRRFLGLVLLPDGTVPLFNDGYPVPQDVLAALLPGPSAPEGITLLADSGIAVLRKGSLFVLADVGDPCPDELPAHAHADTLSFLLYDGGAPVVTEVGTSTYTPGVRRRTERSTAGHSTVEVDGEDSTEVWGAFRAARRARVAAVTRRADGDAVVLRAQHNGYSWRAGSPVHRRTWRLSVQRLVVRDEIKGSGRHTAVVRVVLAPGLDADRTAAFGPGWRTQPVEVAQGWGRLSASRALCRGGLVTLPWTHEFSYTGRGTR
jgi:uncharacterized heparinase superfamily protein